ncbi:polysaccharide pyruvyl transferase CsaB [bacterium]|nr:polysaccharide pyruvyl transferase CsaB [bacterium]
MVKKFVLSGYFGFKNFGDEAILSVIVQKLQQYGHKITVFSSDPKYTVSKFKNISSVNTFKLNSVFSEIIKSDCLISGGGSLLQDTTSFKSLLYYLFVIFLALIFGKKVIIFAQGIGPISNPFGRFLTKNLLKHCIYLSVRDIKSYELLKSWGIKSDLLCDPVFSTEIIEYEKEPVVAIQLRDFRTMNEDFIDRLAQKIVTEFSDKKLEIYSFQDSIDLEVCKNFEKAVKMLNPDVKTVVYSGLSDSEIVTNISKSEYLIGMRFHSIIVGLISGVKTMAINYDIKVEKLANEFEIPLIGLRKDFRNEFELLKKEDLEKIRARVNLKNFDWSGFENVVNN